MRVDDDPDAARSCAAPPDRMTGREEASDEAR
jgi:hypothetical protein